MHATLPDLTAATTVTVCAWVFADASGEGGFGTIARVPEAGTEISGYHFGGANAADTLRWSCQRATTIGIWTFPATFSAWHAVAVSYDSALTTNDPVARVDFADVTETETSTPVGVAAGLGSGISIGGNNAGTRTWDGRLAHVQTFNVLLTASEMDAALRRPGSIRRGMKSWHPLYHATYLGDLSGQAGVLTLTGAIATADGPPIAQPPFAGAFGWRGAFTAAAAGGGLRAVFAEPRGVVAGGGVLA